MKELLLVIMLFFCKAIEGSDDGMNEDCIVKNKIVQYLHTRTKMSWIALLTKDIDLNMYVVYEGKDFVSDREELNFQLHGVYRVKRRNREFMDTEEILGNISWPLGWTKFTAEIENTAMKIYVNSHQLNIDFEFPVEYLSIISDNLASCSRGLPMWEIRKDETSTIPLDGLENIHFSLSSSKSFSPVLHINDVIFKLQYYSGVKIGLGNSPFPGGAYEFLIKKENEKLILHFKKEKAGYDAIFEMALADDLTNMKLSSLDESFFLELTPKNFENFGDIITTTTPNSNHTCPHCNGHIALILSFIIFVAGIFIGAIVFYIYIKYIGKVKKNVNIEDYNETESGRCNQTHYETLSNVCFKCGNKDRISTFSDQEHMRLVPHEDQNNGISALDTCEELHENGIIIKIIKMSQDKDHVEHNFQVCYFNEMIPEVNKKTKVILLVGDPDVGKTTLINAMVNHIFGADNEYEINWRLKVVCDSDHDHKTAKLSAYCFPYQPPMIYDSHFVFIRTHNFSNTSECEHNKTIMQIKDFLDKNNGVNELHAICFVVNSDNGDVKFLRDAYDSIFSLFGYDIKNNIFVLTTFDKLKDEKPEALKALDKIQKYYNSVFRFNLDKDFLTKERIREVTFDNMANLFKRIDNILPCSLQLTNVMVKERKILKESVEDLREKITKGVDKMSELQKKESEAPDPDALKEINVELKHMEEIVITKINEAKRANERLNELTLPTVPHTINGFIDKLIKSENKYQKENYEDRIDTLEKMKDKNLYTKDILQVKPRYGFTSIFQSFMNTPRRKKD